MMIRVFVHGPGDLSSISGRHTKDSKMVFDAALLNTQHYKGKVEQSRKRIIAPPTLWCSSYRKGSLRLPLTTVTNFTLLSVKLTFS